MGVLFCVCLIASNLFESKLVDFFGITLTGGLFVFPVSYILNDCISEVWGFRKARLIIWLGFIMNFFVVILGRLLVEMPSPSFWHGGEHFNFIFSFAPRVAIASFTAFIVGSFINAFVMSKMKVKSRGKNFSARAIISTLFGETGDSLIFFPIAFAGLIPFSEMVKLVLTQIVLKTLYEIIVLPVTIRVVKKVKKIENTDVYDDDISYNVFKVKDL